MHFIRVAIFTFFTTSFALTYWVDGSCNRYPAVRRALNEALIMAQYTEHRLGASDPDMQFAFRKIFNTDTNNRAAVSEVRRIMGGIGSMTYNGHRDSADVRIYCDQDARWELQDDRERIDGRLVGPGDQNRMFDRQGRLIPNRQRHPQDRIWVDRTNGMFYRGYLGRDRGMAITYFFSNPAYHDQRPGRATMTLCTPGIEEAISTIAEIAQDGLDIEDQMLGDGWAILLSQTILHEMTHIPAFNTLDVDPAYGWDNVIAKSTQDALRNAENYAYLGTVAVLGLAGYKLDPNFEHQEWGKLMEVDYVWVFGQRAPRHMLNTLGYGAYYYDWER